MVSNIVSYSILLLYLLPCASWSQGNDVDLSLEQSLDLLHKENKSLKIAGKEVEWARNEHQKLNAFWYPSVNAAGAFVHMSNPIEVRQSLSKYTEPAKEFVHNYIPDNELIMSVLDNRARYFLASANLPRHHSDRRYGDVACFHGRKPIPREQDRKDDGLYSGGE